MIRWPLRIEGCSRVGCIFKLSIVQLEEDKWPLTGLRFTVSSPFSGHSLYPLYQKQAQLTVPCGGSPTPPFGSLGGKEGHDFPATCVSLGTVF